MSPGSTGHAAGGLEAAREAFLAAVGSISESVADAGNRLEVAEGEIDKALVAGNAKCGRGSCGCGRECKSVRV